MSVASWKKSAAAVPLVAAILCAAAVQAQTQAPPATATTKTKQAAKAKDKAAAKSLLDLNTATAEEMVDTLPGIGEARAKAIVENRPYLSIDDLSKAKIPAAEIEKIRGMVTVSTAQEAPKAKTKARTKSEAPEEKVTAKEKTAAKEKVAAKEKAAPSGKVDLNTATLAQLETLPGIGPALGREIIAARPLKTMADLDKVKGMGPAKIEGLRDFVAFGAADEAPVAKEPAKRETAAAKATTPAAPAATATTSVPKVDLNSAALSQLESLPGIGPVLAREIVAARPIRSFDDLDKVKGMGKSKIDGLRDLVSFGAVAEPPAAPKEVAKRETPPPAKEVAKTAETKPAATKTAAKEKAAAPGALVNINTATAEELDSLFGIGEVKSQAIIDARPFKTKEDIMKVKGIKEGVYSKIKDRITVD